MANGEVPTVLHDFGNMFYSIMEIERVLMEQHRTSDQYLTSSLVWFCFIQIQGLGDKA